MGFISRCRRCAWSALYGPYPTQDEARRQSVSMICSE